MPYKLDCAKCLGWSTPVHAEACPNNPATEKERTMTSEYKAELIADCKRMIGTIDRDDWNRPYFLDADIMLSALRLKLTELENTETKEEWEMT